MGWIQQEKCKTCEHWKDTYEGCYAHRGGWCPDFSSYWAPTYQALKEQNKKLKDFLKDVRYDHEVIDIYLDTLEEE